MVITETRRLNGLVENLIELTRFDAGAARLVTEVVDVIEQVAACLDAHEWAAPVTLDASHPLRVRLDPRRLDVILTNLIGNALKHGGSPVTVGVLPQKSEFLIEVRDSGSGVPEEALPYIFNRFFKADSRRPRFEGSGLGLSIAQENARLMGGDIQAANQVKSGAIFTLRLPRRS